jgi:hypothetical protein
VFNGNQAVRRISGICAFRQAGSLADALDRAAALG